MWGLTTIVGGWLLMSLVTALVGGVAAVGKTAVQAGTGVAIGAAQNADQLGKVAGGFGLDVDDALRPINQRLQAEGKPAVTAEQLRAAANDVVQQGWRQGRVDRALLVNGIAQNTALSRPMPIRSRRVSEAVQCSPGNFGDSFQRSAVGTGRSAPGGEAQARRLGIFGALVLGLASAICGRDCRGFEAPSSVGRARHPSTRSGTGPHVITVTNQPGGPVVLRPA